MLLDDVRRCLHATTTAPPPATPPTLPTGFDLEPLREVLWTTLEELETSSSWAGTHAVWTTPGALERWASPVVGPFLNGIGRRLTPTDRDAALAVALRATVRGDWDRAVFPPSVSRTTQRILQRLALGVHDPSGTGDVARTWCQEHGTVDGQGSPTLLGKALLALRGREALEFALAVGVELSVGRDDEWRAGPLLLTTLLSRPLVYDEDLEFTDPFPHGLCLRLADLGAAQRIHDHEDPDYDRFTVQPEVEDLVRRVATEPDSRFRALVRTLVDAERNQLRTMLTGQPRSDSADLHYARSVAHDVRNLLLPLRTALDGLREELGSPAPDAARRTSLWGRIDRAVDRLAEHAADAARISAVLTPEELAVGQLVAQAEEATAVERNGRILVHTDLPPHLRLYGSERDWVPAFANLLRNSAQARKGSGNVWIRAEEDAVMVHLYVDDDGPGVPEELRERVLQPGESGTGGSGQGLALARRAALLAGGTLTCEDAPEGGARFHFALPRRSPR